MTKSLKSLWGRFLFQDRGILPTKRLQFIFLILTLGLLIGTTWEISWTVVILLNLIVFFISLLDLLLSPKKNQLIIKRSIPTEIERGLSNEVQIKITNNSPYQMNFRLVDGIPQSFQKAFPIHGTVYKETISVVTYETIAQIRGKYDIYKLYFRYKSLLGLWEKQTTLVLNDTVKVIPDLTETRNYLENAQQFLLYEGMKIRKHQSGSGEFTKIRSFAIGDDPRKINWRQTAKLQEVMANEYEPEHGKYMTVLIDCGRMMGAELSKGNRLERVLEAALTVTAAALKKGDYVSVLAFSKNVKVYVPPGKGMAHLQTVLQAIYHLEVDAAESNYAAVLTYLQTVQKKRSLILLFSDVQTFLHEESALTYLKRLRQRHLFLMIGIEDKMLLYKIREKPVTVQNAMMKSIAQQHMLLKKREKIKWEAQGLQMIEAREEKLAIAAVSYYIDVMNRGLL
ncbi:DUF58 domain-containing protein [Metabacillus bambusae]|uniref:DUF58 domain-containing protein n=1 Tax=Metabacillus bambusae TaxID=2795218 RepID=A0ABS3N4F7_9BACI|nr:DUF58 domain-containing protein [Metabacillus bambusae]MBO1513149.1 DUF58 domain-containing protein [Metabacillus bambusae]